MKYRVMNTNITRTSDRKYSHAVIVKGQTEGKAYAYCGSLSLAEKALRDNLRYMEKGWYPKKELVIIPVEVL